MKKTILVMPVMIALLIATGCAKDTPVSSDAPEIPANDSVYEDTTAETSEMLSEPLWMSGADIGDKIDTISFTKDMGEYSVNVSIDVHEVIDSDMYQLIVDENSVNIRDSSEEIVSSKMFSSPFIAGAPTTDRVSDYKAITAEVLELDSGNLLVVGVPVEFHEKTWRGLSVYYFDDDSINYIRMETRGNNVSFFPLIDGEITTDGDTFTVNEYESSLENEKRTITYSVDFENILVKEVENTEEADEIPYGNSDNYIGTVGVVEYREPMEGYSLDIFITFLYDEENDNYKLTALDPNGDICIKNNDGEIVSQILFNNPYVGSSLIVDDYKGITPEVLKLDSGNLLIVRVPAGTKEDTDAQCLSVFYFDDHFVNYIGKQEYGGDFFPLIDGEITTDGDTFTVNEYDGSESEKRTVTYSVDFENILIKEVTQ